MQRDKKKLIRLTTIDLSLDKFLRGQLQYLNQYFDVVGVAADTGLLQGVASREGIRCIDVPMHRKISLLADIRSLWRLYRLFRKEKPFILHANTPKGSLLGMIAAWIAHIPNRIYLVTGLRYQGSSGLFRILLMNMERLSCTLATKVVPEGQGVLHTLRQDRITSKPLAVLHYGNVNGICTDYYSNKSVALDMGLTVKKDSGQCTEVDYKSVLSLTIRRQLALTEDDFVFVFVGRIVRDKGICELVKCMHKLSCKLILVGSFDNSDPVLAEDKDFLQQSANVKCVGWKEDVRPYLAAADALVFPSYREGFPNVPLQAGAMGIPSIVTDINGCNETITDGLNGKIIQPRNEQALLEAMQWMMGHREELKRMSFNCRKMIQDRFEQRDVWKAILEMYQSL